jgi:CheY-like chemotaxis protein
MLGARQPLVLKVLLVDGKSSSRLQTAEQLRDAGNQVREKRDPRPPPPARPRTPRGGSCDAERSFWRVSGARAAPGGGAGLRQQARARETLSAAIFHAPPGAPAPRARRGRRAEAAGARTAAARRPAPLPGLRGRPRRHARARARAGGARRPPRPPPPPPPPPPPGPGGRGGPRRPGRARARARARVAHGPRRRAARQAARPPPAPPCAAASADPPAVPATPQVKSVRTTAEALQVLAACEAPAFDVILKAHAPGRRGSNALRLLRRIGRSQHFRATPVIGAGGPGRQGRAAGRGRGAARSGAGRRGAGGGRSPRARTTGRPASARPPTPPRPRPARAFAAPRHQRLTHPPRLPPPAPVTSDSDDQALVAQCLVLGAADFLCKPLRHNELRNLWTRVWWWRRVRAGAGARRAGLGWGGASRAGRAGRHLLPRWG